MMAHASSRIALIILLGCGVRATAQPLLTALRKAAYEGENTEEVWKLLTEIAPSCSSQQFSKISSWFGRNKQAGLLHEAIRRNNRFLVELFTDVTSVNYPVFKETSLHIAARSNVPGIIYHLLGNGARVEAEDFNGCTPLHRAVIFSNEIAARLFLEHGADPNATQRGSLTTPLHRAAQAPHQRNLVPLLLKYGAETSQADERGKTALHLAVVGAKFSTIQLLLKHGADINAADRRKKTPLHLFIKRCNIGDDHLKLIIKEATARLLINHGADIYTKDIDGNTPLDLATGSFKKTLEQMDRAQLRAIKAWSKWLHEYHEIPTAVVKCCILEMALTQAQRDRLAKNTSSGENDDLERTGLIHGLADFLSCCIL